MSSPSPFSPRLPLHAAGLLTALLALAVPAGAQLWAGTGVADVTPPVGTPSAGYGDRRGAGMEGVHDALLATALVIDDGATRLALLGVDHLGFDHGMVQEVSAAIHESDPTVELFLASSHTHAGGGAYLDIPGLGEMLAGRFDAAARRLYVEGAIAAVREALGSMAPARVGIGYGRAPGLAAYRGDWPPNVETVDDLTVIRVTDPDGTPRAVWFHFAAHPTVLPGRENMQFSADFVGFARRELQRVLGDDVVAVYFNGAQGDVSPRPPGGDDMWQRCEAMGTALAAEVLEVWQRTEPRDQLEIEVLRHRYRLAVEPTSTGARLPVTERDSELGLVVLDLLGGRHALVAVPGELSTIYDADLKRFGRWLGFAGVTVLGLTNDAHGYIITPESWRHRTYESTVSFGGESYGEWIEGRIHALLHAAEPPGSYQEDQAHPSSLLVESESP